jgi:hypoxia-inducible factor prolyl 4-hydroxylase
MRKYSTFIQNIAANMFDKELLLVVVMAVFTTAQYKKEDTQNVMTDKPSRFCSLKKNCHELFARREGFQVGHIQVIQLKGQQHQMLTRSLRPLMFEIPHFLSDAECDRIVERAEKKGLDVSKTMADDSKIESPKLIDIQISRYKRIGRRFANHFSSVEKMTEFINQAEGIYPRRADAEKMFKIFDVNDDNNITEEELFLASDKVMKSLYNCLEGYKSNPLYRSRYSSQTWLPIKDKLLHEIEDKIVQATNLPKHIVENSEDLQVSLIFNSVRPLNAAPVGLTVGRYCILYILPYESLANPLLDV